MAAIMDDTHGIKKHEYDKIALLGIFGLSLLVAYLIVSFRSRLLFSDPIRLSQTGLSVSIPSGQSWQSEEQWNYRDNMFSLISLFPRGSERPSAWANCRYLLSAETATPQMRFEQRASAIDAVVMQTNRTQTGSLTIDWARIDIPELNFSMFFGTSTLPDNRQLDIEVGRIAAEAELTQRIFERVIESLEFEDNRLLKAGAEIVAEIKSRGIDSFLNNRNRQAYFLVTDETKRKIGFTMDTIIGPDMDGSAAGNQPDIRAKSQFYTRGQNSVEHIASFQCSNNLDKFVYKSATSDSNGKSGAEIILNAAEVITIREFKTPPGEKSCQSGPAMIPDIFFNQLLTQMLDSEKNRIIVDIIEATGKIIPAHIAAVEVAKDSDADEKTAYVFKLELLDGRGFSERLYLNDQKQVYKRLVRQHKLFTLERTSAENITNEFPEYAERFL
ncbi:MAG: hypothetical protein ACYSTT_05195 [Planctomycetota bacterium]|jgi:hypothetical protein